MKRTIAVLLALSLASASTAATRKMSSQQFALELRTAAISHPLDQAAFNAYYQSLQPDEEGFVVVEGDLIMSPDELRRYVRDQAATGERPARRGEGELLVDVLPDGRDNLYRDRAARRLTYTIDPAKFTQEQLSSLEKMFTDATEEWESVCPKCGIDFVRAGAEENPFFTVRRRGDGRYLAAAFFPDYAASRRFVNIDPSFFMTTGIDRTGILRHELGHVLGYRHEHIRDVPGCYSEGGMWRPLTTYDPRSVMHYFCGGGGSLKLQLTESDRKGHRDLYGPGAGSLQFQEPPTAAQANVMTRRARAVADPTSDAEVDGFAQALPQTRDGSFVVVEGDLLMSPAELRRYLIRSQPSAERRVNPTGELIVNQVEDPANPSTSRDDVYPPGRRLLRYRVERDSFRSREAYELVRENMRRAVADWRSACEVCDIRFEHASALDTVAAPEPGAVHFTVREEDHGGAFIAAAFFPHTPASRRLLIVDPSYYKTRFDKVGVLRHELGHVIGYRHEHIRGVPECYQEDGAWRPVTPYDPRSVMHYFCGGGGSMTLELSETDREGHRAVYGTAAGTRTQAERGELVIRFEGGEVESNAARVLTMLTSQSLLGTRSHVVAPGENIDAILKRELSITPGDELRSVATRMNRGVNWNDLTPGAEIKLPNVRFDEQKKVLRLDPANEKDAARLKSIKQNWGPWLIDGWETPSTEHRPDDLITLVVRSLETRVSCDTPDEIARAKKAVADFLARPIANTYVRWVPEQTTSQRFYSFVHPQDIWDRTMGESKLEKDVEGDLGKYIELAGRTPADCGTKCPEVVLMDKQVAPHPDLAGALVGVNCPKALIDGEYQDFKQATFDVAYHGTHLAGIIGARQNGFGLVGVDPVATIHVEPWEENGRPRPESVVASFVNDRALQKPLQMQIYVFATHWECRPAILNDPDERFSLSELSVAIRDAKPLWVASAGDGPRNVTTMTNLAPMNLGDLPNVLVVTACEDCFGARPRLHPKANYSKDENKIIHVAGPGMEVPSTAAQAEYARAGGTSQAAAFAGGLASAMVRQWSQFYSNNPATVKERIEVTSRPVLADASMKKIAAGVVDGKRAMLNPQVHWLDVEGIDIRELSGFEWLKANLDAQDERLQEISIAARNIVRIVSFGEPETMRWVVYEKKKETETGWDRITRIGPLKLRGQGDLIAVLVRENGAVVRKTYKATDIEDLLLSDRVAAPHG